MTALETKGQKWSKRSRSRWRNQMTVVKQNHPKRLMAKPKRLTKRSLLPKSQSRKMKNRKKTHSKRF